MYSLGIDLGTTYTAAATASDGRVELFHLGGRASSFATVAYLSPEGEMLIGEDADRRARADPARAAREFKRRAGDPTPLMLGGTPYSAETLAAMVLRGIVAQVTEQRGERPSAICITHPASYGPYKTDLLRQSVRAAGLENVSYLPEPVAAALHYASQERIKAGAVIAIYDLGGGTFDSAVLRKTADGFQQLGIAEGLDRLGGIDFDQSVFAHVASNLGGKIAEIADEPTARSALLRLREECKDAKEALSTDMAVDIPVLLPNASTEIRLTRSEFEEMIRPRLEDTINALDRAVRSAGLTYEDLDRVLLVGGSSRIPLVGETVTNATHRPVSVDAHPKNVIALGAARFALENGSASSKSGLNAAAAVVPIPIPIPMEVSPDPNLSAPAEAPTETPAKAGSGRRPSRRTVVVGLAIVAALLVAGVVFAISSSGGDSKQPAGLAATASPTAQTATAAPTEAPATSTPAGGAAPVATTAATTPTLAPNTARINGVSLVGGKYQVDFQVAGFTPNISSQHVHFFFNTVTVAQAGVPGGGPWFVYGAPSPFTGYGLGDKPAAASQMCILVAKSDHSIIPNTGNCFPLP